MIHHTSAAIALLTNRSRGGILIDPAMLDGRAPVVSQVYEQCVCAGESPRQGRDHERFRLGCQSHQSATRGRPHAGARLP